MRPFISLVVSSVALAQSGTELICNPNDPNQPGGVPCNAGFAIQLFEPALGSDRLFTVTGPDVLGHLNLDVGVMAGYQNKPLTLFDSAGQDDLGDASEALVESQMSLEPTAAIGLYERAQIGLALPLIVAADGDYFDRSSGNGATATGIGDLRVDMKVPLFKWGNGFGGAVAFAPVVTAPTGGGSGDNPAYRGETNATVRPRVAAGLKFGAIRTVGNLGYLVRENVAFVGDPDSDNKIEINDQIIWGAGAGVAVSKRVELIGELFGRNAASSPRDLTLAPMELDAGARIEPSPRRLPGLMGTLGAGTAIHKGVGSPVWRGFVAVNWTPDFTDIDRDGIFDRTDNCPDRAEDRDGFEDGDGCPEVDNDRDLIPDVADRCPDQPEDRDTHEDEDGCPDADNDKDGIPDIQDECPFAPGPREFRGCTAETFDSDNDGVKDATDKCRDEVEDADGFEDEDGCPDPDNDRDTIPDAFDDCPGEAEDVDTFEDENGCPEPDNDRDGVLDGQDKCPTEQEVINGVTDEDGCPDRGESKVALTPDKIEILDKVFFKTGSDQIKSESFDLLNQVAMVIRANPQVGRIRVEGHTDNRGGRAKNLALSQRRAESVLKYLSQRGVPADRLEAQGYGPDRPVVSNRTGAGRETNRRVDFVVVPAGEAPPQQE
jgi:outer membrane protein OmpA-like peptidoglycan-associated protein